MTGPAADGMRIHLTVKGHVQGVGYRYFVRQTADGLSLTGWVRNCLNGDVETEAQGGEEDLEDFIRRLESGHTWARVDRILKETLPDKKNEGGFEITF